MDQSPSSVPPPTCSTAATSASHHFVLVHGAGHGAWCWYKVRRLLEASGYRVTCLDLTGAGIDRADPDSIRTLDEYDRPLHDFMARLENNEKVILVGHSAGGLNVTRATRHFPAKVAATVYVAATMLKSGFCSPEDLKDGAPDFSALGDNILDVTFGAGSAAPPTTAILRPQFQREILYHMCPEEDSTLASMLIRPYPLSAFISARLEFLGEDSVSSDSVRTVFVKTLQDRVMKPQQQEAMIRRWPPSKVVELDTDHSPFFSAPEKLVAILLDAARDSKQGARDEPEVTTVQYV